MATEADLAAFEGLQKIIDGALTPHAEKEGGRGVGGRWLTEEHTLFLHCLRVYGKDWKKCATILKFRTVVQVRTHAQKYFQKVARETGKVQESSSCTSANPRKMRMCRRCRGHGVLVPLQGHVTCPHTSCTCARCVTNKGTKRNTRNDTAYAYERTGSGQRVVPEEDAVAASQILLGAKGGRAHGSVAAKNGHGGGPWQGSTYASSSSSAAASSVRYGDPSLSSQGRLNDPQQHGFSAMASAASAMVRNISGAGGAPGAPGALGGGLGASSTASTPTAAAGVGGGNMFAVNQAHKTAAADNAGKAAAAAMLSNALGAAGIDEKFGGVANASAGVGLSEHLRLLGHAMSAVAGARSSTAQYGERHGQDQGRGGGQQASKRHKATGAGTVASQQTGGAAGGLHGVGVGGAWQKMPRFGSL
jgi:SHAQKYF class myb-like DNA-binding protein